MQLMHIAVRLCTPQNPQKKAFNQQQFATDDDGISVAHPQLDNNRVSTDGC